MTTPISKEVAEAMSQRIRFLEAAIADRFFEDEIHDGEVPAKVENAECCTCGIPLLVEEATGEGVPTTFAWRSKASPSTML